MFNTLTEIKTKLTDVLSMLRKLVCIGEVSKVDPALRRVKVTFPAQRYPESDWLPVLGFRSKSVSISCNLEPGEQVLCLFIPGGSMMSGFVLGSMANKSAKPYTANVDKFGIRFKDGTLLEYDQSTQTGTLKIKGGTPAVTISPEKVLIDAKLEVTGTTLLNDTLDVTGATQLKAALDVTGATTLNESLTGKKAATFAGLVGAAGFGSASGGAAVMSGGASMQGSVTINGVDVTVTTHTHNDAEGRPTSAAKP